jgi:hypothetical protein
MSSSSPHLLLRAPAPSQLSLSFCEATPRDMQRWIAALPKANLGETARQLYQGLLELNQLVTRSDNRLQLLELLRPEVYYVCKHLERHFLNQSIVLDDRARKVANLCQALQNHLAVGYKQIICRIAPKFSKERSALLSTAIQRALHCLNGPLIRASLLYCPVPDGLWRELHQLYQVALHHQLQRQVVADGLASHARSLSIEQTYAAALLIGSSRCNQMRQHSIARLADVLESWGALVKVQATCDATSLFAVAPATDGPPRYTSLFVEAQSSSLLGLDPRELVKAIDDYLQRPTSRHSQSPLLVPPGFSTDLLQHVSAAWGDVAERTFHRAAGQGNLNLCIGMSALHYYLSGECSFSDFLKRPNAGSASFSALPIRRPNSVWERAFDTKPTPSSDHLLPYEEIQYHPEPIEGSSAASDARQDFPLHSLNIINHSPGGYCLAWPKDVPAQLQAGELIGIQDSPSHGWSIAVVRWVRQVRGGGTQMGIELIAPHAQPCGLQLLLNTEESSQYMRGLLLPEISAIDIPASILAPRLPFQEGHKVLINTQGEERWASLGTRVSGTGSYNQFEYKIQETAPAAKADISTGENFDSLWKIL